MTLNLISITKGIISSGSIAHGYKIFFSPPPDKAELPTVWLDLHIWGGYYQPLEDDSIKKYFKVDKATGAKILRIRPQTGVRLFTEESIGTDCCHTAVVTNTAGRAKHGLIVAPGKIDPGFSPNRLVLVVYNQSKRKVILRVGDRIAAIAFAQVSDCKATNSTGHMNGQLEDFQQRYWRRAVDWVLARDLKRLCYDLFIILATAILTWFFATRGGQK